MSAEAIDELVLHVTQQMEIAARQVAGESLRSDEIEPMLDTLRSTMASVETLALADLGTGEVWTVSMADSGKTNEWLDIPGVITASETGRTQVFQTSPAHLEGGHPALGVVAVAVDGSGSGGRRVLIGELHLRSRGQRLVPLPRLSSTSGATIVDDAGNVLASSNGNTGQGTQEHSLLLEEFLSLRETGVAIHHPPEGKPHVIAFAPFSTIPGGVIVEEREDVVLAVPRQLRRNLIIFGSLALVLTSIAAWVHAWSAMRPVRRLTSASRAIADGVLDQPIQISRRDEIGALAGSFEIMRQKLLEAERQRKQWEQEMERRVEDRTAQVHNLLSRVISAQEEERKRVARELHDQVAQDLATISVTLQRLVQSSSGLQDADRSALEQAQQSLGTTLKEMRRIISDLRPSALDDLGLESAIRSYAESRAESAGLRMRFEAVGDTPPMDGPTQTALFRILQEAVSNVARHAGARNLQIRLEFSEDAVAGTVEDDGKGFDVGAVIRGGDGGSQLGVLGMRERASLLGGSVDVDSRPGRGTTVRLWIPLSE